VPEQEHRAKKEAMPGTLGRKRKSYRLPAKKQMKHYYQNSLDRMQPSLETHKDENLSSYLSGRVSKS
jgi:hypothetical protein